LVLLLLLLLLLLRVLRLLKKSYCLYCTVIRRHPSSVVAPSRIVDFS
jgi:hypothetical protein